MQHSAVLVGPAKKNWEFIISVFFFVQKQMSTLFSFLLILEFLKSVQKSFPR